ncbi:GTA-gp10 family protein [Caulobacter sp. ErkDOM-E]|uniref:GTA-gp10 family protein n=1 Tax=Caulobacter sp. ErkDOM-E TaxID=3402778 RepID=UPI003AF5A1E4
MPPPNPARGEVAITLAGTPRRLCLTLGALARIEGALNLTDWRELPGRMETLSARELLAVLAALIEGEPADLSAVTIPEAVAAVAATLAASA